MNPKVDSFIKRQKLAERIFRVTEDRSRQRAGREIEMGQALLYLSGGEYRSDTRVQGILCTVVQQRCSVERPQGDHGPADGECTGGAAASVYPCPGN